MNYNVHLTQVSSNSKTGPIPVSTTESTTCNPNCAEKDTCFGKFGPIGWHWKRVSSGERGTDWLTFCDQVKRLPKRQLWRHNQAGDLPGDGHQIDEAAMYKLVQANKGKRGFTYSHYPWTHYNLDIMEYANKEGFTVNLSCDTLKESDRAAQFTKMPLVCILPSTTTEKVLHTPAGRKVVVCPVFYRDDMNCMRCGICQNASPDRAIVGFPAHATRKRVIDIRLQEAT